MDSNPDREMSLIGHLTELRTRLIVCLLGLAAGVFLAFFIADPVLSLLTRPIRGMAREPDRTAALELHLAPDGTLSARAPGDLSQVSMRHFVLVVEDDPLTTATEGGRLLIGDPPTQRFYYHSPLDPIMIKLKVAMVVGVLLALPLILWQVWLFISPGLTAGERRVAKPILMGAVVLFPIGAVFAYGVIALLLRVMQHYAPPDIDPLLNIFDYLRVMTTMMLVFGVVFELPLVVAIAARVGLVTPAWLQTYRRHAYVVLAVAAMVLTPADPYSMLIALVPLIGLYELSVALARPMALLHERDARTAAFVD